MFPRSDPPHALFVPEFDTPSQREPSNDARQKRRQTRFNCLKRRYNSRHTQASVAA